MRARRDGGGASGGVGRCGDGGSAGDGDDGRVESVGERRRGGVCDLLHVPEDGRRDAVAAGATLRIFGERAAAKRLQIPERTLRHRARRGRIPGAFKEGKLWKFPVSGLIFLLQSHRS